MNIVVSPRRNAVGVGPALRPPGPVDRSLADMRRVLGLGLALMVAALPLLLLRGAVAAAAGLHPLAGPDAAWFPAGTHGAVLVLAPVAVLSSLILFLAPGLLLAIAVNRARTVADWVLHGFALSLIVVSVAAGATQQVVSGPLVGDRFVAVLLACTAGALVAALLRVRDGSFVTWPFAAPRAAHTLAGMMLVPVALLIALAPKFYWEAFNGDGAHAYEAARLLLYRSVPFFNPEAGDIAGFPGTTSFLFAYPASWFIRLFGRVEVSARLPLLLFLIPLAAGLIALIEEGRARSLRTPERWLIWLALTCYVVAIGFSATYSPYSADLALPATQDTLLVVAFLGFALAFIRRAWAWAVLWAFLTYTSLPNGLLLLGFWLAAWWLVQRPRPWRHTLSGGAAVAAALVAASLLPLLLAALGAPTPGGEYGAAGILLRFAFLQVTDWPRLAYLVVPCGILPALALPWWRRQDPIARAVTLVTVAYFLFVYVQAHASLHYYIPAMILPLVVFWRIDPARGERRRQVLLATAGAGIVALALSWPAEPGPFTAARVVGSSVQVNVGGYRRMGADALRASTLLHHAIPYDWDPAVPHASLGGSPLVFQYYAHTAPATTPRNYVLLRASEPAPAGARRLAEEDGFALYVRDDAVWRSHLALRPAAPAGAAIYRQPRSILFRSVPHEGRPRIIDLPALATRLGIDVDALARRLGVEP